MCFTGKILLGCKIMKQTFLCGTYIMRPQQKSQVSDCAKLCANTQGCEGWTFGYGWCWGTSTINCRRSWSGFTSGGKACGLFGVISG